MNAEELRKVAEESDKAHWFPGAAYIHAFKPKTAIALLDRLAVLEAGNVELRKVISGCVAALSTTAGCSPDCSLEFMKGVPGEIAGTVAELRRDAARLDYLQEHGSTVALVNIGYEGWDFQVGGLRVAVSPSIRAAIDAALKETP